MFKIFFYIFKNNLVRLQFKRQHYPSEPTDPARFRRQTSIQSTTVSVLDSGSKDSRWSCRLYCFSDLREFTIATLKTIMSSSRISFLESKLTLFFRFYVVNSQKCLRRYNGRRGPVTSSIPATPTSGKLPFYSSEIFVKKFKIYHF